MIMKKFRKKKYLKMWFIIYKSCRCGGMADALVSDASGKPCEFESHHLHQKKIMTAITTQWRKGPLKMIVSFLGQSGRRASLRR